MLDARGVVEGATSSGLLPVFITMLEPPRCHDHVEFFRRMSVIGIADVGREQRSTYRNVPPLLQPTLPDDDRIGMALRPVFAGVWSTGRPLLPSQLRGNLRKGRSESRQLRRGLQRQLDCRRQMAANRQLRRISRTFGRRFRQLPEQFAHKSGRLRVHPR